MSPDPAYGDQADASVPVLTMRRRDTHHARKFIDGPSLPLIASNTGVGMIARSGKPPRLRTPAPTLQRTKFLDAGVVSH